MITDIHDEAHNIGTKKYKKVAANNDRNMQATLLQLILHFETVHIGHVQVEHDAVRDVVAQTREQCCP